jgi:hypothetical protein
MSIYRYALIIGKDNPLKNVKRVMLATQDAHGLYEKCGFKLTDHADKIVDVVINPETRK